MPTLTYAGRRLVFPDTAVTIRSDGYISPPRVYEPETVAHINRVAALNGVGVVANAVDDAYKFIKSRALLTAADPAPRLLACIDARFGIAFNGVTGRVNRVFSVLGDTSDAVAADGFDGPVWRSRGFSDKPELQFTTAALRIPQVPAMLSGEFAHFVIGSTNKAVNGNWLYSHHGPGITSGIYLADGFYRANYTADYQGYNIYISYGDSPTYDGQTVRSIIRYKQSRSPFQLLASGNGIFSTIYSTSISRDPYSYTRDVVLGASSNGYDTPQYPGDVKLSTLWMLSREDAAMANDLDNFLRTQYNMPS